MWWAAMPETRRSEKIETRSARSSWLPMVTGSLLSGGGLGMLRMSGVPGAGGMPVPPASAMPLLPEIKRHGATEVPATTPAPLSRGFRCLGSSPRCRMATLALSRAAGQRTGIP
jgi:hypothetical protein